MRANKAVLANVLLVYGASASGFLASLYLASVVSISQYAVYGYAVAIGAMLYLVVNLGSDRRLVKDMVEVEECLTDYVDFNHTLKFILFLLAVIFGFLLLDGVVAIICGWYVLTALFPKAVYDYHGETTKLNLILLLDRILLLVLFLLFVNEFGMCVAFSVALLLRALLLGVTLRRFKIAFKPSLIKINWSKFRRYFNGGALVAVGSLLSSFQILGSQIYAKNYASDEIVSFLSIGFQISILVQLAQTQVIRLKNREISLASLHSTESYFNKLKGEVVTSALVSIPFVVVFVAATIVLERNVLAADWFGFSSYMLAFVPWLMVIGPGNYISQYFLVSIGSLMYVKIYAFNFCLTLASLLFLLPLFGPYSIPVTIFFLHGASIVLMYAVLRNRSLA